MINENAGGWLITTNDTSAEKLAAAIVWQAIKDYKQALKPLPPSKKYRIARNIRKARREEIERFFGSEWYRTLTSIPPEVIVSEAMKEKRANVQRRFVTQIMKGRKRKKEKPEDWQAEEIKRKRARRNV